MRIISKLRRHAILMLSCLSAAAMAENPIASHVYTADPAVRVINDRVYVIATHDQDGQNDYGGLIDYYMFSSNDMVNWQDHGIVWNSRRDSNWANLAYAPDFIERNGKYYLYFPDGGGSIGVAVADRPEGPYRDPIGRPLVDRNTPNAAVQWIFDPGVFIDDNGQAYLYFGGGGPGNARVIRLNNDMISTSGSAISLNISNFFEALYMHKRNGVYYLSYSGDPASGMTIDYMTSNNPTSGFTYRGTILDNPWENNNNNNHQSIVEYKGQPYIFYHNRVIANERGANSYQRSVNVDRLYYNSDGTIRRVTAGRVGAPQIRNVDAFALNQAETFDMESGIETEPASQGTMNLMMGGGEWVKISRVDFGSGATNIEARVATENASSMEVILDSLNNTPIVTMQLKATGGWQTYQTQSAKISRVTGVHDVYLRSTGYHNLDWYRFTGASGNSSSLSVELESLAGNSGFSPFSVRTDSGASGGSYIVWPNNGANQMLSTPSDGASGQVKIPFTLSEAADVEFQIRVSMANGVDDSFYYKLDNGAWNDQNNAATQGWGTLTPATFTGLNAGNHTLTILRREDGALLDVANLNASNGTISLATASASKTLTVELEKLAGNSGFSPFAVRSDGGASGGQYVVWPNNGGNQLLGSPSDSTSGQMLISFSLSETTNVEFKIRVSMANGNDDSFYYKLDNGSWVTQNNTATQGWGTLTPATYTNLSAGDHQLRIVRREDGAQLDNVTLSVSKGGIAPGNGSGGGGGGGGGSDLPFFVGNITTGGQVRSDFTRYWDQITPENEGKWGSVERTRDVYDWSGIDRAYNYAKANNIPFKQHTFVWGSQAPSWIYNLSASQQAAEIEEWIRDYCQRYPDTAMIDVVNEATPGHAPATYAQSAFGNNWIIKSFQLARQYCPNAVLILNDYNVLSWNTQEFINMARPAIQAGVVDAIGLQAHGLANFSTQELSNKLNQIAALGLPIYITEYDIEKTNDSQQLQVMQQQFPLFYNHPSVKGITLWGYVVGSTWVDGSGLIYSNGTPRPAMTWLMNYLGR